MLNYVLGFMYSKNQEQVLLILKSRPDWQKHYYNGIGGHVEDKEHPDEAMRREFCEETSINYPYWEYCIEMLVRNINYEANVYVYKAISGSLYDAKSMTDESIGICNLRSLPDSIIPNLKWIIPMLLQPIQFPITVTELSRGGFTDERAQTSLR